MQNIGLKKKEKKDGTEERIQILTVRTPARMYTHVITHVHTYVYAYVRTNLRRLDP